MKRNYLSAILIGSVFLSLFASSCKKNLLEKEPFDKLVPSSFFNTEKDLQLYTNSFYQRMIPGGLEVVTADEWGDYSSKNKSPDYIAGNYTPGDEPAWSWGDLRNINYFLQHFNNSAIPQAARDQYEGVARFFRAWFYFDKVKRYGDVPWYSNALDVNDSALYKPRDSRELVMDSVIADLDFAINHLSNEKDRTSSRITRPVALAFKSRVCLFEGCFRKYHTEFNLTSSANDLLRQAADAAKKLMDDNQYTIYNTGNPQTDYRKLFISENPVSEEVLLAVIYNNDLKRWHNITWKFNSATYGSRWGLNKQFIDTYLKTDGSRFTDQPGFDTLTFVNEMADRDYRLAQTVRSLGYKRSDGSPAPPNFGYTFTGYHILKFSLDDKSLDGTGESYNSIPLIRYAEVLLNYAEAKAELGEMTEEIWNATVGLLRKRAGVNPAAPMLADPYLMTTYFPAISDKYLLEIRRERGIELVYEGFRYDDLLRWKKADLLKMHWKGIYVPAENLPMDLDGNGTPDVAFVESIPGTKVPGVIYYVVDGQASRLTEGTKGNITWRDDEDRTFEEKKYLHPISNTDIILNPNLEQNPGW